MIQKIYSYSKVTELALQPYYGHQIIHGHPKSIFMKMVAVLFSTTVDVSLLIFRPYNIVSLVQVYGIRHQQHFILLVIIIKQHSIFEMLILLSGIHWVLNGRQANQYTPSMIRYGVLFNQIMCQIFRWDLHYKRRREQQVVIGIQFQIIVHHPWQKCKLIGLLFMHGILNRLYQSISGIAFTEIMQLNFILFFSQLLIQQNLCKNHSLLYAPKKQVSYET